MVVKNLCGSLLQVNTTSIQMKWLRTRS